MGYIPWKGFSHEDGVVISESTAKKFTSEHMYTTKYKQDKNVDVNKRKFVSIFPGKYEKKILDRFDDNGLVKTGTVLAIAGGVATIVSIPIMVVGNKKSTQILFEMISIDNKYTSNTFSPSIGIKRNF